MRTRFENAGRLVDYTVRQLGREPAAAHRLAIMAHIQRLTLLGAPKADTAAFLSRLADTVDPLD